MTPTPQESAELQELTLAYHDGTLTAGQAERLEFMVMSDPAACAEFVQRSALVADLQWQYESVAMNAEPPLPAVEANDGKGVLPAQVLAPAADAIAATANAAESQPAGAGVPITVSRGNVLFSNIQQHPLLYLAAGIVLLVSLWSFTGQLLSGRSEKTAIGRDTPLGIQRSVARLTRTLNAQWGVGTINEGAFLRSGQRLELVGGLAEVTYKNGAVVLLEAPASFLLNDREFGDHANESIKNCDAYLEAGRISVRVPPSAHGFAVQTAVAIVTDMGAEFGLAVSPSDAISLVVFSGSAEMRLAGKYGAWRQRVDSNCCLQFDPRELSPIPQTVEEAGPFVRKLPEQLPPLMLHWDFNDAADDGKLVLDRSGQGRHGRFVGNAGRIHLVEGAKGFGQAFSLNGVDEFVELVEPQWSRLDDSFEEFTLALWLKPNESRQIESMVCGKMGYRYRRGWQLSLTPKNLPRFVFFRGASDNVPVELIGKTALPSDKFSHLAVTFKGLDAARLYLNGELIGTSTEVPMRMNGANYVNFQVGNRGDGYRGRYFEGLIDDLRIYRVALTSTMLRRLINPQHQNAADAAAPASPNAEITRRRAEQ